MWCPRCRGALMAPLPEGPPGDPRWSTHPRPQGPPVQAMRPTPPRLPPGFRWIAVRPGAAPPVRHRRRHLGPTPRYAVIPRWGLADRIDAAPAPTEAPVQAGPSAAPGGGGWCGGFCGGGVWSSPRGPGGPAVPGGRPNHPFWGARGSLPPAPGGAALAGLSGGWERRPVDRPPLGWVVARKVLPA